MFTESLITKFAFVACFAGVAMLITGSLPQDKMEQVNAMLGGKVTDDNQPPLRVRLLLGGAFFLFIGLLMFGVIRLPNLAGQVEVPKTKTEMPTPYRRPSPPPRPARPQQ